MEVNRLIIPFLLLIFVFPDYSLWFVGSASALILFKQITREKYRRQNDELSLELLFRLGTLKNITEKEVSNEMKLFKPFRKYATIFEKTSKLTFPNYGWRSSMVVQTIKSVLATGNTKIISKSLNQISERERSLSEAESILSSQKYTLIASVAISSSIMGLVSSMSDTSFIFYVIGQAIISGIWISFFGQSFFESLLFSLPLALLGYFMAFKFM